MCAQLAMISSRPPIPAALAAATHARRATIPASWLVAPSLHRTLSCEFDVERIREAAHAETLMPRYTQHINARRAARARRAHAHGTHSRRRSPPPPPRHHKIVQQPPVFGGSMGAVRVTVTDCSAATAFAYLG